MIATFFIVFLSIGLAVGQQPISTSYTIEDTTVGRVVFNGLGGISGGGATSVLLPSYPADQLAEILDYLFLPNFGASLQICKVEIGGDAQSTDGSESSYMHAPWVQDFETGYEWFLMKEAKKRNPDVKLYGLPWAFPQWLTCSPGTLINCTNDPYTNIRLTAEYIVGWVAGAKQVHGLDIDFVGSWNERAFNVTYLITLRKALDAAGFPNTKIIAADNGWDIADAVLDNPELAASLYALGSHYPGTTSSPSAQATGMRLWASEDGSTYNNQIGAGCWARIINQNFVNGNMSSTINWNMVAAYMKGTHWYRAGLMNALQPWTGSYGTWNADGSWTAGPMIWATAHTTQFTSASGAWSYLPLGAGAGLLQGGGSYVTFINEKTGDLTIVIEKMSRQHSMCVRPTVAPYTTVDEAAMFKLLGGLTNITSLNLWSTFFPWYSDQLNNSSSSSNVDDGYFRQLQPVAVVNGVFSLNIEVDTVYTLTTLSTGKKGSFNTKRVTPTLFPTAYVTDFEDCAPSSEAAYFSDQNGAFECHNSFDPAHGIVMQQMVPLLPVTWSGDMRPFSLIGHRDGKNLSLTCEASIQQADSTVMFGVHMSSTTSGSYSDFDGVIWGVDTAGVWGLWSAIRAVGSGLTMTKGQLASPLAVGSWHTYRLDVVGDRLSVWVDGQVVIADKDVSVGFPTSGHGMIGVQNYGDFTLYDNFQLYTDYTPCTTSIAEGAPLSVVECSSEVGLQPGSLWQYEALPNVNSGFITLRGQPDLCVTAVPVDGQIDWPLKLATCSTANENQLWSWYFQGVAPDNEQKSWIYLASAGINPPQWITARCLTVINPSADIGSSMTASPCVQSTFQAFWYDFAEGEIGNEATATCLGVC